MTKKPYNVGPSQILEKKMSKTEVAKLFGVSRPTVHNWIKNKKLPQDITSGAVSMMISGQMDELLSLWLHHDRAAAESFILELDLVQAQIDRFRDSPKDLESNPSP